MVPIRLAACPMASPKTTEMEPAYMGIPLAHPPPVELYYNHIVTLFNWPEIAV